MTRAHGVRHEHYRSHDCVFSNRRQYPGHQRLFGVETIHAPTFHTWKGSQRLLGPKTHESIKGAVGECDSFLFYFGEDWR